MLVLPLKKGVPKGTPKYPAVRAGNNTHSVLESRPNDHCARLFVQNTSLILPPPEEGRRREKR